MYGALPGNFGDLPLWGNLLIILGSMLLVAKGAQWVVESASHIAKRFGISELVIGLTVVSLGTSAPEFAVTLIAAFKGQGNISVGNIVGSNIFNLGFILGGCALVRTIPTPYALIRRDGFVLAAATVLLLILVGWNSCLDRYDGAILFLLLCAYLAYLFKSRHELTKEEEEEKEKDLREPTAGDKRSLWLDAGLLVLGLVCIIGSCHFLIGSATAVARWFKISDWVIGITIVAAGTSAPEFVTSMVAVLKGRYGISAGNIIGSNIFNLLGVLGLAGLIRPVTVDGNAWMSLMALSGLVFVTLFFMRTGWCLSRLEGFALVVIGAVQWAFELLAHHGP